MCTQHILLKEFRCDPKKHTLVILYTTLMNARVQKIIIFINIAAVFKKIEPHYFYMNTHCLTSYGIQDNYVSCSTILSCQTPALFPFFCSLLCYLCCLFRSPFHLCNFVISPSILNPSPWEYLRKQKEIKHGKTGMAVIEVREEKSTFSVFFLHLADWETWSFLSPSPLTPLFNSRLSSPASATQMLTTVESFT